MKNKSFHLSSFEEFDFILTRLDDSRIENVLINEYPEWYERSIQSENEYKLEIINVKTTD